MGWVKCLAHSCDFSTKEPSTPELPKEQIESFILTSLYHSSTSNSTYSYFLALTFTGVGLKGASLICILLPVNLDLRKMAKTPPPLREGNHFFLEHCTSQKEINLSLGWSKGWCIQY